VQWIPIGVVAQSACGRPTQAIASVPGQLPHVDGVQPGQV
jgi:hypothetical protein